MNGTPPVHRTRAALTAAVLGLVVSAGGVASAAPGAVPAAIAPTSVPLMPGTSAPYEVVIADDAIYSLSRENGPAVYRRSITTDETEGTTTLGPATFVGHATDDGGIAADDGTVAYARSVDARLVLADAAGSEVVPAWDTDHAFLRGMNAFTGTWISAHTIGMGYRLLGVATGDEVDLRAATPAPPAEITSWGVQSLRHTDTRVLWTVTGHSSTTPHAYAAVYTSALDAEGLTGPVELLEESFCESPACGIAWPVLVAGDLVAWRGATGDATPPLRWFVDQPYTGTPQELLVPASARVYDDGEYAVVTVPSGESTTLTWYDLTSPTPDQMLRAQSVPGTVLDVHGPVVAYRTPAGVATLEIRASGVTADPTPAVTPGFTDVPPTSVWDPDRGFRGEIQWLADHGIVGGYADGTFRPLGAVNRDAMAAFLYRAAHDDADAPACTAAPFTDVPVSHPFCGEIAWLADTGITTGWSDGTFRPGSAVTREAMAAFLYRFAHDDADAPDCTEPPFADVATTHPFCGEIAWTADAGISRGWSDGTFRPGLLIERQAMAAFLFRFLDSGLVPTT